MLKPVLVLNANFEPINVTNTYRALNLILSDKATLILNGRGTIRTVSKTYPIPSIIRLRVMISRPRPHVHLTNKEVFRRDEYTCQYCGKSSSVLTIDHVVPKHMGGKHNWVNVVAACPRCNHLKGGKTLQEAHMTLRKPPHDPPTSAIYLYYRHLPENQDWLQYIENW